MFYNKSCLRQIIFFPLLVGLLFDQFDGACMKFMDIEELAILNSKPAMEVFNPINFSLNPS